MISFATSNSSGFGSSDKALKEITGEDTVWMEGKGIRKGATAKEIANWVKELGLKQQ